MNINICLSPILYPSYITDDSNTIVVVVDVFRATTTMCTALKNGAKSIIPVKTIEEAKSYKSKGYLVGGERDIQKLDFSDFGNTPSEYSEDKVAGKDIVISTTNGTIAINKALNCYSLVIGSFCNISTIAQYCISQQKDVLVLCAGWKDTINIEDSLFGGALIDLLSNIGFNVSSDSAQIALSIWREARPNIWQYIQKGEHFKRLEEHNLTDVAKFCLESNTTQVLPVYIKEEKKIIDILSRKIYR